MNIRDEKPGAITSRLTEAQIRDGFELHVCMLTGDVSFHRKAHYDWRGVFRGRDAVVAAHDELMAVRDLCWP